MLVFFKLLFVQKHQQEETSAVLTFFPLARYLKLSMCAAGLCLYRQPLK